jgi:hypothetical protein
VLMCMEPYNRSRVVDHAVDLFCQYRRGHEGDLHSWEEVAEEDRRREAEEEAASAARAAGADPLEARESARTLEAVVLDLCDGIAAGEYDRYLERILAAGHDRKRARRGVWGFRRRDREAG